MFKGLNLRPPIFEVGLKGYLYGDEALALAKAADRISIKYDVPIIFDPQHVDIPAIARETERLLVFAQHADPMEVGPGNGHVLLEALKQAGATGTLLNHAERRLKLSDIAQTINRADEVGMATVVCADSPDEAAAIAQLGPNIILAEPPELIGTGQAVGSQNREFADQTVRKLKSVNPDVIVFLSAGIRTAEDVAEVMRLGAEGTGATSGIVKAKDPVKAMEGMVRAMKEAWEETRK